MIRLRNKEGKCFTLQGPMAMQFVELCDEDGNLAAVIMAEAPYRTKVIMPGDVEFSSYRQKYGLEQTNVRFEKETGNGKTGKR